MEPKTYLSGERLEPMRLPDFQRDFKNYERFDIGAIGEFDVAHSGRPVRRYGGFARSVSALARRLLLRGSSERRPVGAAGAALCFALVKSRESFRICRHLRSIAGANDISMCTKLPRTSKDPPDDLQKLESLTGTHTWLTEEGPVVIDVEGDSVLITESLDQPTTEQLEHELFEPMTGSRSMKPEALAGTSTSFAWGLSSPMY